MPFAVTDNRLVTARRIAALVDALSDASAQAQGTLAPNGYSGVLDDWGGFDGNHSQAVARLAVELGRRLGVAGEELEHVHLAALLHDIGKIGVPDHILNKGAQLSDTERALVERHSVIGYELVRGLALTPVDTYVLHHHERWDGAGYPHGLAGAEIPFGSRLILVADAFDALTSDRSYRRGVSVEAAMQELQAEAGRQFDPLIVSALHDLLSQPQPTPVKEREWSLSTSPS
jgi:putative nucleotidyltransferase with HDIG domain